MRDAHPILQQTAGEKAIMQDWIANETRACRMSDKRLHNRLQLLLDGLSAHPEASIPDSCETWAATQAAYRFLNNASVNAQDILRGHTAATVARMKQHPVVLVAQDTTFLNLAKETRKANMGTLAVKESNEYLLHPAIAFTPQRTNLGILHHHVWKRPDERIGHLRHLKPISEKESVRWLNVYACCHAVQAQMPDTLVVTIGDRESDIYELYQSAHDQPAERRAEFIVRAKTNRRVEGDEEAQTLWETMAAAPVKGQYALRLGRTKYRGIRDANFAVRWREVTLLGAKRIDGRLPPVTLYAVYATELSPPAGEKPIEWMLLSSLPVETLEQAQTLIGWYRARWEIEIYFHVLKSGCRVEALRLESDARLENALAVYMLLAWRLHTITMQARETPEAPCTRVYADKEWRLIYLLKKQQQPTSVPSVREITRLLAMHGGFLARKGDGEPGAETIWRGYTKLLNYLEVAEALQAMGYRGSCV